MNTFLPYPDFAKSAACLDRQRLGKQRVEVLQILKALRYGGGWKNHPAVKMWAGCEWQLYLYGLRCCQEWRNRGYVDNTAMKLYDLVADPDPHKFPNRCPKWLGNAEFHASHRSNLLRKFPEWYSQFGWTEPPTLPYVWPV